MHVPSSPLAIFVIRLLSSSSAFLPVQSSPRECAALLHPPTTIDRRRRVVRVRTTTPRSNDDDDNDYDDDDGPLNVSPTKDDARRHLGRGRRGPPPLAASVRGGGSPSPPSSSSSSFLDGARAFASKNVFPMGMVVAVSLARSFPELGRDGGLLRPELFIGEYGAASVFLLSGLGLKSADLASAASNGRLNALIQSATFAAWPFLVGLPLTRGLRRFLPRLLPGPLLDGVLVLTCLPTTINMAVLLTSTCKGSVATALCNTVISNLLGIFVTPALLFLFFGGAVIELPFLGLVGKLCKKVMLPVAVGQALRATPIKDVYSKNEKIFKRLQEVVLLGIVWNAFCNAFVRGIGLDLNSAIVLLIMLPLVQLSSFIVIFYVFRLKLLVDVTPGEVVAATFCAGHKTLAFGLPLINMIFEGSPHIASYCAPIMLTHPLQLVIGSLMAPFLTKFATGKEGD